MYMQYGAKEYRKFVNLPGGYTVDGVLTYGIWDLHADEKALPHLKQSLESKNIKYSINIFSQPDIGHCYELIINNKTY